MLHGGGGDYRDWSLYSDAGQYAAQGLMLVMPEGGFSYWVNAVETPADRYEDFLVKDLPADVEARFAAAGDRRHRAVVGMSMGGRAAVELALRHPEMFAFAGAISPAIEVTSRRFSWMRWDQSMRFQKIFGPDGSDTRRRDDPFALVKTAEAEKTPYLYVTAGENEPLRDPIERFAAQLKRRGFAYEFHAMPGGHDWSEWDAQLPGCFAKLMKIVQ